MHQNCPIFFLSERKKKHYRFAHTYTHFAHVAPENSPICLENLCSSCFAVWFRLAQYLGTLSFCYAHARFSRDRCMFLKWFWTHRNWRFFLSLSLFDWNQCIESNVLRMVLFLCWYSIIEQCISVKHNLFRFLSKVDSKLVLYEVFCSIDISTKIGLWRYCRNTRISNTLATQCFSIRAPTIFFSPFLLLLYF